MFRCMPANTAVAGAPFIDLPPIAWPIFCALGTVFFFPPPLLATSRKITAKPSNFDSDVSFRLR